MTELTWRNGPIRVLAVDFVAKGDCLPRTAGGTESAGQYIKRFRVVNDGTEPCHATFGVYVQAEVNGGIGEPGLSWHDQDRTLLAINRGHGHVNRKLARDATVEFALALDDRGEVQCEPTGPDEAILLRKLAIPAGGSVSVDLLVSGAFTGWRGDPGTFEHWLRPALAWFRSADLDAVEQATAQEWDAFIEPLPGPHFPKPAYAVSLRRSALAVALHADEQWGAIASGFDRGLSAYCWPREALWAGRAMDRAGHPEIGRKVFQWLAAVKGQTHAYAYWFQKYTIDGQPEWETPAIDQTAMIPWAVERHYRQSGDLEFVAAAWPIVERAAGVGFGDSGHPGLRWVEVAEPDQLGRGLGQPVRGLPVLQRRGRRRAPGGGPAGPDARPRGAGPAPGRSGPAGSGRSASSPSRPPTAAPPGWSTTPPAGFSKPGGVSTVRGWFTEDPDRIIDRSAGAGYQHARAGRALRAAAGGRPEGPGDGRGPLPPERHRRRCQLLRPLVARRAGARRQGGDRRAAGARPLRRWPRSGWPAT